MAYSQTMKGGRRAAAAVCNSSRAAQTKTPVQRCSGYRAGGNTPCTTWQGRQGKLWSGSPAAQIRCGDYCPPCRRNGWDHVICSKLADCKGLRADPFCCGPSSHLERVTTTAGALLGSGKPASGVWFALVGILTRRVADPGLFCVAAPLGLPVLVGSSARIYPLETQDPR